MRKTTRLKQMLQSPETEFLMEAHNGLSARIVEEAGFAGIWGSGLSISAALGVRDSNEASWTQVLEVAEFMSDGTSIPILLDGDTGYGNFNSVRRLVKKLEQRGLAGVCLEDKLFPKRNSFSEGPQELAVSEEFCGKLRAAREAQTCADFVVVARTEALIAGLGLAEALRRGEAYRQAGADALLVHSKSADAREILTFLAEWGNRLPIVLVPTTYFRTPVEAFEEAGVSVVIWANHLLRSALVAMQQTARTIHAQRSLAAVEPHIASMLEVFRLQDEPELSAAEGRYLPVSGNKG